LVKSRRIFIIFEAGAGQPHPDYFARQQHYFFNRDGFLDKYGTFSRVVGACSSPDTLAVYYRASPPPRFTGGGHLIGV
jgi:hypothetical protein